MNSLKRKFDVYISENPRVYEMFEMFAMKVIATGRKNFGAKAVIERMRWYTAIETNTYFKLNNNYTAFLVRMFEERNPLYKGFFRTRISEADRGVCNGFR